MFSYIDGINFIKAVPPPSFISYFFTQIYINPKGRWAVSSSSSGNVEMGILRKLPVAKRPPSPSLA